ncbi:MAG: HEAT repeat domain-containing protein, partial [Thaumarchaeota archaeon]|nr:HEAT repeat domain-containing protein [Nitrososphaerota archaeon]
MSRLIIDESNLRSLPVSERLDKCLGILMKETDESLRWDAVWLAGEIAEISGPDDPIFGKVSDLMAWVLKNEANGVVKHEACYQIAARNMREKIPDLIDVALKDPSIIARHESIESLGLMRAFDTKEMLARATNDPNPDVKETALFVLKRLERLEKLEEN